MDNIKGYLLIAPFSIFFFLFCVYLMIKTFLADFWLAFLLWGVIFMVILFMFGLTILEVK